MLEYSTVEVAEKSGATLRMLQNWSETEMICPKYVGHSRRWSAKHLREVQVVATLRDKGLSIQQVRKVMARVRYGTASRALLLTDGKTTHIVYSDQRAIELLSAHRGSMALVVIPALEQD